jgi:hypothetical protein
LAREFLKVSAATTWGRRRLSAKVGLAET